MKPILGISIEMIPQGYFVLWSVATEKPTQFMKSKDKIDIFALSIFYGSFILMFSKEL